jgi:hypothetical protein
MPCFELVLEALPETFQVIKVTLAPFVFWRPTRQFSILDSIAIHKGRHGRRWIAHQIDELGSKLRRLAKGVGGHFDHGMNEQTCSGLGFSKALPQAHLSARGIKGLGGCP